MKGQTLNTFGFKYFCNVNQDPDLYFISNKETNHTFYIIYFSKHFNSADFFKQNVNGNFF